jgi:hypothetical protein
MILSSLLISQNLLSSRGLVKISASCSLVLTCEITVSLDGMVSQEVVSDIDVFGSRMLTRVVSSLDGTLIVTYERYMVQSVTIIHESLSHPNKLCTTTPGCNILCFDHR